MSRLSETFQSFGLLSSEKVFVLFVLVKCKIKKTEMVKNCKNKSNQKKFKGDLKTELR